MRAGRLERVHGPHFSVSYSTIQPFGGSAVVVPKKVVKKAVNRHLLKRRMRAILLPHSSSSRVLVVYAKAGASKLPFGEIERELSELISRILQHT